MHLMGSWSQQSNDIALNELPTPDRCRVVVSVHTVLQDFNLGFYSHIELRHTNQTSYIYIAMLRVFSRHVVLRGKLLLWERKCEEYLQKSEIRYCLEGKSPPPPPPPKALKKTLAMLHMHFPEQIEYTTTVIGAGLPAVF